MGKKLCLFMTILAVCICPMSVSAEETWDPAQDASSQIPETSDGTETVPELAEGKLSVEVKYTGNLTPHKGDRFRLAYQVAGSDAPATITLDAEEINGYVGEIAMSEGAYEVLELEYIGSNAAIETYAIEDHFTVSEGGGDTICLVIGSEAFDLSGQDGYCVRVGEKDLKEDIPSDETDEEEPMEDTEETKETKKAEEEEQTRRSGPLKFIFLLLLGGLIVLMAFLLKKTDLIQD